MLTDETAEWLLAGDPAVRWQVKADLLGAPEEDWKKDRALVGVGDDWAGRLLQLLMLCLWSLFLSSATEIGSARQARANGIPVGSFM